MGASAVTANGAGTKVAGNGIIPGTLTMNDGTILALGLTNGDAVGTLIVNGNVTLNDESKYILTVTPGGVDKVVAGATFTSTGNNPNVQAQAGFNSEGLTLPTTVIDVYGANTKLDESALPAGWDIEDAKVVGNLIRLTAAPIPAIPTLSE